MPKRIGYAPVVQRYCPDEKKAERDRFYRGVRWIRLSKAKLSVNPLCEMCLAKGEETLATLVHHVMDRLARPDLAYTWENLQSACGSCHTRHHFHSE